MPTGDSATQQYVETTVTPGYTYFIRNGDNPVYCVTIIGVIRIDADNALVALVGHQMSKLVCTWVRHGAAIMHYAADVPLFFDPVEVE